MRNLVFAILGLLALGFALPIVGPAQAADCQHGEIYDSHGSRCR